LLFVRVFQIKEKNFEQIFVECLKQTLLDKYQIDIHQNPNILNHICDEQKKFV